MYGPGCCRIPDLWLVVIAMTTAFLVQLAPVVSFGGVGTKVARVGSAAASAVARVGARGAVGYLALSAPNHRQNITLAVDSYFPSRNPDSTLTSLTQPLFPD